LRDSRRSAACSALAGTTTANPAAGFFRQRHGRRNLSVHRVDVRADGLRAAFGLNEYALAFPFGHEVAELDLGRNGPGALRQVAGERIDDSLLVSPHARTVMAALGELRRASLARGDRGS